MLLQYDMHLLLELYVNTFTKSLGSVAEGFKAPVLKTGDGQPSVSSNLTASAIFAQ